MVEDLAIEAVTVHPDGALVTRSGSVDASGGMVEVRGLPLSLHPGSLRAELEGGRVHSLRLELDLEGVDRADEGELERRVRERELALRRLESERDLCAEQLADLEALTPPEPDALGEEPPLPSPERLARWVALSDQLGPWFDRLRDRLSALSEEIVEADEALKLARHALEQSSDEARWRRWTPSRVALVGVEGAPGATLRLSYRVTGARWSPCYRLYSDGAFTRARLELRALVAQVSGEDWSGVRLALSTLPSARAVDLPELPALKLGVRQPNPRPAWRELPDGLEELFPRRLPSGKKRSRRPVRRHSVHSPDQLLSKMRQQAAEVDEEPVAAPPPPRRPPAPAAAAPPPPSPAPARPAPKRRSRKKRSRERAAPQVSSMASFGRAGGAPIQSAAPQGPPPPPPVKEMAEDALDYGSLRLAPWDARPGKRGRLRRDDQPASRRPVPAPAVQRLRRQRGADLERAKQLRRLELPPHHVLPNAVTGIDHLYRPAEPVDLPSDGSWKQLRVDSLEIGLELRYRAIPREDPRVFRAVRAQLPSDPPLLPGPAEVRIDGSLELTTAFGGAGGGRAIELDMGVEDGLKLARNVRYSEESAGLLRGQRRLSTTIDVELASSLDREARVDLLERLPVAGDDRVEVKLTEASPPARAYEGEPDGELLKGGRRQALTVPAGGTARATLGYAVTLDNDLELKGGDRRG